MRKAVLSLIVVAVSVCVFLVVYADYKAKEQQRQLVQQKKDLAFLEQQYTSYSDYLELLESLKSELAEKRMDYSANSNNLLSYILKSNKKLERHDAHPVLRCELTLKRDITLDALDNEFDNCIKETREMWLPIAKEYTALLGQKVGQDLQQLIQTEIRESKAQ